VSIGQVGVDYAYDVPDLKGHMELALHLDLPQGVECAQVPTPPSYLPLIISLLSILNTYM